MFMRHFLVVLLLSSTDNNTHHGGAPVLLICGQVANSKRATANKALTVEVTHIVSANTGPGMELQFLLFSSAILLTTVYSQLLFVCFIDDDTWGRLYNLDVWYC
jgi:hypothetical protein